MTRRRRRDGTRRPPLGQHFLRDRKLADRFVAGAALVPGERVLEIGPGRGILTTRLAATGAHLEVIEIDREFAYGVPLLEGCSKVAVHIGDAAILHWPRVEVLVANLPFQVSGPVLGRVLDPFVSHPIGRAVLMVQLEVASRLCAKVGTRDWGRLSAKAAYAHDVERLEVIPPGAFDPPPKVRSAIVHLRRRAPRVEVEDLRLLWGLIDGLFQHRRKQARNSLLLCSPALGVRPAAVQSLIDHAGAEGEPWPRLRPEALDLPALARLCDSLARDCR